MMSEVTIGDPSSFAVRVFDRDSSTHSQMRNVDILVGGVALTARDNQVYLPAFVHWVEQSMAMLEGVRSIPSSDSIFNGRTPSQIHELLLHGADGVDESVLAKLESDHLFLDWGETTFGCRAFLFRLDQKTYLTVSLYDEEPSRIIVVEISAAELKQVVVEMLSLLRNDTD